MSANYPRSLCLPLELKKVFMDEQRCTLKEEVFEILKPALVKVLQHNSTFFIKHCQITPGDIV